ncbi:MAG: hypothetical protein Q9166_008232 [cf. Caloplaca sp. 2 TL-2023]
MDPLSITASVIAVLHVTNKAVSFLVTLGNAPRDRSSLMDELKSTRNVLEDLAQLANSADSDPTATGSRLPILRRLTDLNMDSSPLARCYKEIEALNANLAPAVAWAPEGSKRNEALQRLKWPFKEKEISKVLEKLARFRGELALALSVDQTSLAIELRGSVQTLADTTSAIQDESRYQTIYRWLAAPDPSLSHNAACKKKVRSTGDWFLKSQQYADWKVGPHSLRWLHGIPGCGKTILSSTIIEDIRELCTQNQGNALAYFYFDFNDPQSQCGKMLRSLIRQLSKQDPAAPSSLEKLHSSCGSAQPTDDALLTVLKEAVLIYPQSYFVLDALDECKSRQDLLQAIHHINAWQHDGLHFLVTSRFEGDLRESLEPLVDETSIMNIQSSLVNEDIRTYVRSRLSHDPSLRRWQKQPEAQEEIETRLLEKADGMYKHSCPRALMWLN